ncbi:MAG: oligoendopeptidase F [Pirellulales bacterium]|nr:oligoendopeptidase F [Pirellulales bacterium]
MPVKSLPPRDKVKPADAWDLTPLFASDAAWEKAFRKWVALIPKYQEFAGKLGDSAQQLASFLDFDNEFERLGERLSTYAFLKTTEDQANSKYQELLGRYRHAASQAGQAGSFFRPELMAIPAAKMQKFLKSAELAPHLISLNRILRYKAHTLTPGEEKLLAMQAEMSETPNLVFRQLNDTDLKFGVVENERGQKIELSSATFMNFLYSPARKVRETAFHQFYEEYAAHANTLAATLSGSIQRDVYYAKARNFPSALENALFPDKVPLAVYDNLIAAVRRHLPALHHYYEVRRRRMKLKAIHHYDTYVPILAERQTKHTWQQAVQVILSSLKPLGSEYCGVLEKGLNNGWCDRYPNRGKQSGAFSCGSFDGPPYILMNYQPEVLDQVFTLAHEAGHSMHSFYSAKHQPFQYYNYTIFVAEVASTFNEQLLGRMMLDQATDDAQRAYLLNREIDAIRGTIFRQTMFAEFEKSTHALAEAGETLTLDRLRGTYRELLDAYFGPKFAIDDCLSLECLRIPHFYRAFYVYKYATGLAASIALSEKVLAGGKAELDAYLGFLKGGCSRDPLELLRGAGVDMEQAGPVDTALARFEKLVDELDELL